MSRLLMRISNFLAHIPGLPVLVAAGLIVLNFVLQFLPAYPVIGWLARYDVLLHLGVVVGLLAVLLGDAL